VSGAVLPHAPVLLPEISGERAARVTHTLRVAARSIEFDDADVVVLLSPHGPASGVYGKVRGSLEAFGLPGVATDRATDPALLSRLARAWGRPVLPGPVDHGVVVPLALGSFSGPVIAAAVAEATGPAGPHGDGAAAQGGAFAEALSELAQGCGVAFVASANTSAGLTQAAPLSELEGAKAAEKRLLRALAQGGDSVGEAALRAQRDGGSCAAGPLAAFGALFEGVPAEVHAYGHPFGVGYLVATARG